MIALKPTGRQARQAWYYRTARACGFNARELARRSGIGLRQLERHFNELFGQPPKVWLNEQRMIAATFLLKETANVGLVARRLNYSRQSNFSREFKRRHGVTPSQYLAIFRNLNPMSRFEYRNASELRYVLAPCRDKR